MDNRFLNSFPAQRDAYLEPVPPEECAEPPASLAQLEPIYVTRPHLPALDELLPELEGIWERAVLTNNGPLHQRLERKLAKYLDVPYVSLFLSGTTALMTALQYLNVQGEVITTPYSFVATSHALLWNRLTPVFVDIDAATLNLDPAKLEAAITADTTAILPVHCYGNPCDVAAIQEIADRHDLKVIYDAAHAFGVNDDRGSILAHGDLSTLSFHATKVFNTFEGGAIVCRDAATKKRIDRMKNFGFVDETTVVAAGINGKLSEFSAAVGLLALDSIDGAIAQRGEVDRRYREALAGVRGISCVPRARQRRDNFAYFPILVGSEFPRNRDELYEAFVERRVFPRKYFYPLISSHQMYSHFPSADEARLPVASAVAESVLCLPIYPDLSTENQDRVIDTILRAV